MDKKYRLQRIRKLILEILHQVRLAGQSLSGGWINDLMLQSILKDQGYELSEMELKDFLIWLSDAKKACIEYERVGKKYPYIYRSRLTAEGHSVALGEKNIEGIAED